MLRNRQIEAQMNLLVDFLPLVNIRPPVGELRFHFRIRQLQEWTRPEEVIGRLQSQVSQGLVVLAAQLPIYLQEPRQQVAGTRGIDLIDHLFQEGVVDLQVPRPKLLWKHLVPEPRLTLSAGISRKE